MKFYSTRDPSKRVSFEQALFQGLAPDGGLYIPEEDLQLQTHFKALDKGTSFHEIAALVSAYLLKGEVDGGAVEALDAPYMKTPFFELLKKRATWLILLFIGEMFTASAMGYFQHEIQRAVVLALFIPLIISSGGNSGSQASTLIIRAMALGEVRLRDWLRVLMREIAAGVCLGLVLGLIGLCRILLWPTRDQLYGEHYLLIALTVGISVIGVVLWGTIAGSMLPFVLKKLRIDPATASAPFVATLVDVTGLIIYFTVAALTLSGTML